MLRGILTILILLSVLFPAAAWPASDVPRWQVRITVPSRKALSHPKPLAIEDLARLAAPPNVAKLDTDYAKTRIPAFPNPYKLREGEIVSVTGWLHTVAAESGGTYLLSLSPGQTQGDQCVLAEIPDPDHLTPISAQVFGFPNSAVKEASALAPLYRDARRTIVGSLLETVPPQDGKSVAIRPTAVTVIGQLFYAGEPPPAPAGCRAPIAWEIAPVTEFRVTRASVAPPKPPANANTTKGGDAQAAPGSKH